MNDTKVLIEKIKEGIQEKKGKNIIIADLTNIEDTICKYFVICQGNSPSQVGAIVDSIKEFTRKGDKGKLSRLNKMLTKFTLEALPDGRNHPEKDVNELHELLNRL